MRGSTVPEPEIRHHEGVRELVLVSPILSREHLRSLADCLDREAAEGDTPLIISSAHPRIFLAGAHLAEIAALDALTSLEYARFGRQVLERIENFPGAVVAAVDGPCTGGGFDLALSCDLIVAGPSASFSHPGVRRGLVTGWGGTETLPGLIGEPRAKTALLEGSSLDEASLQRLGIHRAHAREVRETAAEEARRMASIHPSRLRLLRVLKRGRFIDRFRVFVVHNLMESLDSFR
jgi:enoyl-CoA hydratase/carnithine racemase